MALTYQLISSVTVGAGGAANIQFTSIPSTYTDLVIKYSLRADKTDSFDPYDIILTLNSTATFTTRNLRGDGSVASSNSITNGALRIGGVPSNWTANTFANNEIYIPNYTGSNAKSWSADGVQENNATGATMGLVAGLHSAVTTAINSITIALGGSANCVQHSTAYLYGIKNS